MLFLKFFVVSMLIIGVSSCSVHTTSKKEPEQNKDTSAKTKAYITQKPRDLSVLTRPSSVVIVDGKEILKGKINSIEICRGVDLDNIDIRTFVLTPEIDQCLYKSDELYNYLLFLYKHDAKTSDKRLRKFIESNSKKSLSLDSVVEIANKRLLVWLNRASEVPALDTAKPKRLKIKQDVVLEQNEFESSKEFAQRVKKTKKDIKDATTKAEQAYKLAIMNYNRAQITHNHKIANERKLRKQETSSVYYKMIEEEVRNVLGQPYVSNDLVYDADKELFYATLLSTQSDWQEEISIEVPRTIAKTFKSDTESLTPVLGFDIDDNSELFTSFVAVKFQGRNYKSKLSKRPRNVLSKEIIKVNIDY